MEGTFTIQSLGQASTNVGVITARDILDCQNNPAVNYADVENVSGGDFWSGLKSFGSKLWPYLQKAHDFIKEHKLLSSGLSLIPHPAAKGLSGVASMFGYGDSGEGGEGDGYGYGEGNGGVLIGGRRMPRKTTSKKITSLLI